MHRLIYHKENNQRRPLPPPHFLTFTMCLPHIWYQLLTFYRTLWQKWRLQFGHLQFSTPRCTWNEFFYDKIDDYNCWKVNIPFVCSNIQTTPAFVVYISQLIWYSSAYGSYNGFLEGMLLLTRKLLIQGFLVVKFKSSLGKSSWCHHDLCIRYGWWMCSDCHTPILSSFMTYHLVCNKTDVASGAGIAYPSRAPEFLLVNERLR